MVKIMWQLLQLKIIFVIIPNLSYLACLIKKLAMKKTLKFSFVRRPFEKPKLSFLDLSSLVLSNSHSKFDLSI